MLNAKELVKNREANLKSKLSLLLSSEFKQIYYVKKQRRSVFETKVFNFFVDSFK